MGIQGVTSGVLIAFMFIAQASAASPVVLHSSEDADAVQSAILKHSDLGVGEFTLTHFDAFRSQRTLQWRGGGSMQVCESDRMQELSMASQVGDAEGALLYLENEKASELLVDAQAKLPCLDVIVPRHIGSKIGFLRGVLAHSANDESAFDHFSFASRFEPDLEWDADFGRSGERLFRAAQLELKSGKPVSLDVVPSLPETHSVFVNGVQSDAADGFVELPVGANVVQIQSEQGIVGLTATVAVDSKPELFIPDALAEDSLAKVSTESGRKELSRILAASFDSGQNIYVAHEDQVWLTASGIGAWESVTGPLPVAQSPASLSRSTQSIAWVSAGLTTAVAAGTGIAFMIGESQWSRLEAQDTKFENAAKVGDMDAANAAYASRARAHVRSTMGFSLAGIGAAITVSGIVITVPMFKSGSR